MFAHALARRGAVKPQRVSTCLPRWKKFIAAAKAATAVIAMIAGVGMVAFRDLHGIRPLVFGSRVGRRQDGVHDRLRKRGAAGSGFKLERDLAPGEVVFIDMEGELHTHASLMAHEKAPCLFEYVYLARPDSVLDGASVYQCRINMGTKLAAKIKREWAHVPIDVVIPIPSTSRVAAQEIATRLNLPYRDALVRNRYVGRTFIMPGQAQRKQSIRRKLNPIPQAFRGKNVLLVDDSIVRGTTIREIIAMVREQGAKKVYVCSAAPPVRFPNVYGIDMPARSELIATGKTVQRARAGHRRRRADLSGPRRSEGRHHRSCTGPDALRHFGFRRHLRHRRRHRRVSRTHWNSNATTPQNILKMSPATSPETSPRSSERGSTVRMLPGPAALTPFEAARLLRGCRRSMRA